MLIAMLACTFFVYLRFYCSWRQNDYVLVRIFFYLKQALFLVASNLFNTTPRWLMCLKQVMLLLPVLLVRPLTSEAFVLPSAVLIG